MEVHAFVGPTGVLVAGAADGPLAGTTLAVKDVIDVVGRVTGAGNPDLAASRRPAERSAPVVDALVAAGATVVGKTVTDELAYSLGGDNVHYPPPVNVAAPGRTTGGSSSGSAAAVTAGIVDLALGTDTGGSIRVPASYCGVLGWRPTHGAVSTSGVTPLAPSFDTVGLFARSGRLLRAAAEPLLGTVATEVSTRSMALASGRPVHLAWAAELLDVLDQHVVGALTGAVADLFGDAVRTAVLGIDLEECLATFRTLQGAEAWAAHGEWIRTTDPVLGPATAARFRAASAVTGEQVAVAQSVRERVRRSVIDATLDDTVLVAAGATGAAPVRAGVDPSPQVEQVRADTLRLMSVAGLSGAPVVVLPGAVLSDGTERLPLGVALIGTPGSDLQLLDFVQHVHVARL